MPQTTGDSELAKTYCEGVVPILVIAGQQAEKVRAEVRPLVEETEQAGTTARRERGRQTES